MAGDAPSDTERRIQSTVFVVDEGSGESEITRALAAEGRYKVVVVPHQADVALRIRERKPESLVIIGSSRSGRIALTSCALVRRTRTPVRPNILFWASDGDALIARCAWAAGADDVIVGPIQPESLAARLTALSAISAQTESEDQKLTGAPISGSWKWNLENDEVERVDDDAPPSDRGEADPRIREFLRASFGRAMSNRGSYSAYYRDIQHDGVVRLLRQQGNVEFSESGAPQTLNCSVFDETHRRRAIRRLTNFDYVEQVPDLVGTVLYEALEEDIRNHREIVGVLCLNIDPLRNVDAVLDETTSNELLSAISVRIASLTRDEDLLTNYPSLKTKLAARGAAKYVVLLRDLKRLEDIEHIASRVQAGLRTVLHAGGRDFAAYATVGAASFPRDGADARSVMQAAEIAMRKGRNDGGDRVVFFHESMRSGRMQKLETELSLRRALQTRHLELHYQPIFDVTLRRVMSLESLLRWNDDTRDPAGPESFIPIAEETSLILELGEWVLRAACAQLREWQDQGFEGLRVSVNVAARQLNDPAFIPMVERILQENSLSPRSLELELTERSIAENIDSVVAAFRACKRLGIRVVIDDFGTGHSALNYLKNFPIDEIKIDKSFVHGLATNDCDSAITATMIDLAHRLNLTVVAEGVEQAEQLTLLQNLGCDAVQGFLFARPMARVETGRWLQAFVGLGGTTHWNPLFDEEPGDDLLVPLT